MRTFLLKLDAAIQNQFRDLNNFIDKSFDAEDKHRSQLKKVMDEASKLDNEIAEKIKTINDKIKLIMRKLGVNVKGAPAAISPPAPSNSPLN